MAEYYWYELQERGHELNVRMLKSDRGRPVSEWRHVWTIEAGAAGGHPVLLIHAGRALWWYGQARKVTYNLIDDHNDRSERSEHDGTARPHHRQPCHIYP